MQFIHIMTWNAKFNVRNQGGIGLELIRSSMDENELIAKVANSDERAFLTLYDRYSRRAYSLIMKMLHDPMIAEDVLQETFLRIWNHADQFDPQRGSLQSWLLTIARRTALERLRYDSHRPISSEGSEAEDVWDRLPEPGSTSEESRWRSLHLAVESLAPELRQVIELAYYEGMSQSEIAEYLDLPLGTVKTRIRSGMLRLREQWTEGENPQNPKRGLTAY